MDDEWLMRLLKLTAFEYCENIWWRLGETVKDDDGKWMLKDPDRLFFLVNCSDEFEWGTADAEWIDPESDDLDQLERAVHEAAEICGSPLKARNGFSLWVARKRRMRPQGAMYAYIDKRLWPLFDEAGPDRPVSILNPKPRAVE